MAGDSLEEIMGERGSAAPSTERSTETHEQEPQGQPRDEHGRFASQQREGAPEGGEPGHEPGSQAEAGDGRAPPQGSVPQQALHASRQAEKEAREEAAAARREVAELRAQVAGFMQGFGRQQPQQPQQPAPPPMPDPLADPEGFTTRVFSEAERNAEDKALRHIHGSSLERAHRQHGELFEQAWNAAVQYSRVNPAFDQAMRGTYDLGEAVVAWYNRQRMLADVGSDPAAYRERVRQELLAEIAAGKQPAQTPAPRATGGAASGNGRTTMPSDFSGGGGGGGGARRGVDDAGAMSLNEIMGR